MNIEDRLKQLEEENKRLKSASGQWAVIEKLWKDSNKKLKETENKLKEAVVRAEEGTKAKSLFLANMSHEIRTPLNGVIGMADILKNTKLTDEQMEYVNIILNSSDSLLQIINDILDFSKIEAGKIELENIRISIPDILNNVVSIVLKKAIEKKLELITFVDPNLNEFYKGDPTRIQQILLNLVNNALKFTHKGEVLISVELGTSKEKQSRLKITVKDTGIGISDENQKKLFQSFSQTDNSTTRKYGGTGLGLAISKRLVEQMGGNIHVESEIRKGTSFIFTLLLDNCKTKEEVPNEYKNEDVRIIGIDDNSTNLKILNKYLSFSNFKHTLIQNPEEVTAHMLKKARAGEPYHVMIVDFQMPYLDGEMLSQQIRSHKELEDVRIILLSSIFYRGAENTGRGMLFNRSLMKPIRHKQLEDAIHEVLGRKIKTQESKSKEHGTVNEKLKIKTLVADDNKINLKVAQSLLTRFLDRIDTADNGQIALTKHKINQYDLIFMDMIMPTMDGITATQKIRELGDKNVKIIAMTANAMKEDLQKCLDAGMDDFITKPYKISEIQGLLAKYFEFGKD
jgi:two-component system sensor histidine kinase/response regulator